jgi:hypothetical protein
MAGGCSLVSLSIKLAASAASGWADTSYETRPKWHSFFFDLTGRFFGRRLG